MNTSSRALALASITAVTVAVVSCPALAADTSDWIEPASKGAESLADSLKTFGAPILGLCLAGFGGWAVMTGHIDFRRLWMFLLGGVFIGVGPTFASWFMELFTGAS